jgi:hypothetical protein
MRPFRHEADYVLTSMSTSADGDGSGGHNVVAGSLSASWAIR